MSNNLEALYQEVILDHNRKPRNFREIEHADRHIHGRNPLCGDEVTVYVKLDGDRIADVSFQGQGCAVSKSSASLMTSTVKGKSVDETMRLFDRFHDMITGKLTDAERSQMGSLAALGGVSKFPLRVKCASLAWHALRAALQKGPNEVTTDFEGPPQTEGA
ncbi:MAG TPA: SUF system NifU family Fe-S cluster assembly protein [Gemmatimonadaceae bacterium]|nr:SUF system NifU family Fe-S cluster assembly protein [Gemmatimonadaceae bacterium]